MINLEKENIQVFEFLKSHDYEVQKQDFENIKQNSQSGFENSYNSLFSHFQAFSLKSSEEVNIKVSKQNRASYEMIKFEAKALEELSQFDSVLKYIDSFDLEDQNIFILITESYHSTLDDMIQKHLTNERSIEIEIIISTLFRIVNSLIEINFFGYIHCNIRPSSIVFDSKNQLKLKDILQLQSLQEVFRKDQSILDDIYLSPELKQNISLNQLQDFQTNKPYNTDIYSLGIIMLQMLGFQINGENLNMMQTKQIQLNKDEIENDKFYNFYKLITMTMINKESFKRCTSFNMRRLIIKYYRQCRFLDYYENERKQSIIQKQEANHTINQYLIFNYCFSRKHHHKIYNLLKEVEMKEKNEIYAYLMQEVAICNFINEDNKEYNPLYFAQESLKVRQNLFRGDHQQIAESLCDVGICYQQEGKYELAIYYLEQSNTMRVNLYGDDHIFTLKTLLNISDYCTITNQLEKGLQYLYTSYRTLCKLFKGYHPYIIEVNDLLTNQLSRDENDQSIINLLIEKYNLMLRNKEELEYIIINEMESNINLLSNNYNAIKLLKYFDRIRQQELSRLSYKKLNYFRKSASLYCEIDDLEEVEISNIEKNKLIQIDRQLLGVEFVIDDVYSEPDIYGHLEDFDVEEQV